MVFCKKIRIFGEVQGVGFRFAAKDKTSELKLTGFARNEPDGTVYIEAEGAKESLDSFINWCRKGPSWARVEKVEVQDIPIRNFQDFSIR